MVNDDDIALKFKATICILFVFGRIIVFIIQDPQVVFSFLCRFVLQLFCIVVFLLSVTVQPIASSLKELLCVEWSAML